MQLYKNIFKPILFRIDPEKAHRITLDLFKIALLIPGYGLLNDALYLKENPELEKNICGLRFKNPVGLAAGFDKNAAYIRLMARLGFSHIEIGTVTPMAQPGNEKPRLFRLPEDEALINRMGFNNEGVDAVIKNLERKSTQQAIKKYGIIIGGNIGKNKSTPNEDAWKDYVLCFEKLSDHVDYFTVNVSSPNTPGLRELQEKEMLKMLLDKLQEVNTKNKITKPLFLKIAPDISDAQLQSMAEVATATKINGIIATNTTTDRSGLKTSKEKVAAMGEGGLSGKPLFERSNAILKQLRALLGKKMILIGSGGINTSADAKEKMNCGADLVQIYTGLIYEGPGIVKNILSRL